MTMTMYDLTRSENLPAQTVSAPAFSCVKSADSKAHAAFAVCAFFFAFADALLSISISAAIISMIIAMIPTIIIFAIIIAGHRALRKQKHVFDF